MSGKLTGKLGRGARPSRWWVVALLSILGLGLLAPVATARASVYCTIRGFRASVFQGPTRGMVLNGNISLRLDPDGSLSGSLLSEDRQVQVNFVGRTTEHGIYMTFDLGYSGRTQAEIAALGVIPQRFADCTEPMLGIFVGPQPGDQGVWYTTGG